MSAIAGFIVESICGQFAKFGKATGAAARLTLVARSEEATRFGDAPSAKVRAMQQLSPSQFSILPVDVEGRLIKETPPPAMASRKTQDLSDEQRETLTELLRTHSYAKASQMAADLGIQISAASLCRLYQAGELGGGQ
jgi:hypothetical protein